ncbi:MAG: glycosyltransferase family 87 protein [Terriglobales bacterium]
MPDPITTSSTTSWLTPRRLRRQALLLAVGLWLGYVATIATPGTRDRFGHLKGADFLHPYVLGTLALDHDGTALYDARVQREIGERRVPGSVGDYFLPVYGPQYSLIWAPLALLPYEWAAAVWMVLSAAIYAACCYAVWRTCPNLRAYGGTVALVAAAFPGFFSLIAFGQNSALALAAFTGAYFALRARQHVLAGFCFGLLAYKPQLAIVPTCMFLGACIWPRSVNTFPARVPLANGPIDSQAPVVAVFSATGLLGNTRSAAIKVTFGTALSIAVQFGAAWAWYTSRSLVAYARVLAHVGSAATILEPKPYLMHSLRAFWNLLLPWPGAAFALYVLTATAAIAFAIATWRGPAKLEVRFAIMLLATALVAPHLTVYDLVILAPGLLWIADWLSTSPAPQVMWLLYFACILPFAGPLARWTHVQLSVVCMAALAWEFGIRMRIGGRPES